MIKAICIPRCRLTVFGLTLFVIFCSEIVIAQQSRLKPVPMIPTRKPSSITTLKSLTPEATVTSKNKRFSDVTKAPSFVFPRDEDDTFGLTENGMQQNIPLALRNQLSDAADWTEFLKLVDNVTVVQDEENAGQIHVFGSWEVDARSAGQGAERDASVPAKPANCIPELRTVPLITTTDPTVLFYPTCTRIERCGGCCSSELLSCEPTKTETVLFQVLKTQYVGGSRMKYAGKESVPVEKHTACKCQCRVKESDCSANQVYIPSACRCECSSSENRRKCEMENQTRYWDSHKCICRCRDTGYNQHCSTGFYFNEEVCQCEPWVIRRRDLDLDVDPLLVDKEDSRASAVDNKLPSFSNEGRKPFPPKTIYKEEDMFEEDEEKKTKPVEHFRFPVKPWRTNPANVQG